jgi:hypothetical protein
MIKIVAIEVHVSAQELNVMSGWVQKIKENNPAEEASKGLCNSILSGLIAPADVARKLNLTDVKKRLDVLEIQLKHGRRNVSELYADLQGLQRSFMDGLFAINFAFIPSEKLQYFEKDAREALFGTPVWVYFPEARNDIKAAGNCLAADLPNAATFHLMRIVEIGLRKLAHKLRVKNIKNAPLDYALWREVVDEIDTKLETKLPKSKGQKKTKALLFKRDLLVDFKAFELRRNEIMHCRWSCNDTQAIGLFNKVRDFMQRLATQISPTRKAGSAKGAAKNRENPDTISKSAAERYADNLMRELGSKAKFGQIGVKMTVPKK